MASCHVSTPLAFSLVPSLMNILCSYDTEPFVRIK